MERRRRLPPSSRCYTGATVGARKPVITGISVLLFLLVSLVAGLYLSQKTQNVSKKAAGTELANFSEFKKPILLLTLEIDKKNNKISVISAEKGIGIAPDYKTPGLDYLTVNIKTTSGSKNLLVPVPVKQVYQPPKKLGEVLNSPKIDFDTFKYSIILPYEDEEEINIEKNFQAKSTLSSQKIKLTMPSPGIRTMKLISGQETKTVFIGDLSKKLDVVDYQLETIFDGSPAITDPSKSLDIIFVSSGFPTADLELFRSFVRKQAGGLIGLASYSGKEPFLTHKPEVKIRSLFVPSQNLDPSDAMRMLASLGIPYDQIAMVLNQDGRSYSTLGGIYCMLFRTWGGDQNELLFAHEFGHSFAALLDEYVEYTDIENNDLWYFDRNCKEDPSQKWINNINEGAYFGCEYAPNFYRPTKNSIMRSLGSSLEFNQVSKYLIEQAFSAYTHQGSAFLFSPSRVQSVFEPKNSDKWWPWGIIYVNNFGIEAVQMRARFPNLPEWIIPKEMEDMTPGRIAFEFSKDKLIQPGKYETILEIEIDTAPKTIKLIPVEVFVGNADTNASLSLTSPTANQRIFLGDDIRLAITKNISVPGFKRINYKFFNPWYNYSYLLASKTVDPFETTVSTGDDFRFENYGTYDFWVEGYPFVMETPSGEGAAPPIFSQRVKVDIVPQAGFKCTDYNVNWNFSCTNTRTAEECFKGAGDCDQLGQAYCCPEIGSLAQVQISPEYLKTKIGDQSKHLSAYAYDNKGRMIGANATYEWGISSNNSVGSLDSTEGQYVKFTPLNKGEGDVYVIARRGEEIVRSSIFVKVFSETECVKSDGDADGYGGTTEFDLVVWKGEFLGSFLDKYADFNCDLSINLKDFEIWRRNFQ